MTFERPVLDAGGATGACRDGAIMPPMSSELLYSVVIPVYNAKATLTDVVREVREFFETAAYSYEIVLVNDASRDQSWPVAESLSKQFPSVTAIDLVKNSGQHSAIFCGLHFARGQWVITLDDDLQNPAAEIEKLIHKAAEGHDLVLGKFEVKQHSWMRRLGSGIVQKLNEKIFNKPRDLVLTNFRLIERAVVERARNFQGPEPYIPGILLAAAAHPANVTVAHRASAQPRSRYTTAKLLGLVGRLLFHYSIFPLRVLVFVGAGISLVAFALGGFYLVRGLFHESRAVGWTSLIVLLSFFSGFIILLLGVLGEYLLQVVKRLNQPQAYFVRKIVRHGD